MKVNISNYGTNALYQLVQANKKVFGYIKSESYLLTNIDKLFVYSDDQLTYTINTLKKRGNI
jgi:hypothetical protein